MGPLRRASRRGVADPARIGWVPRIAPLLLIAGAILGSSSARAQAFTPPEAARLARGETVVHPERVARKTGRYVGGVTYTILDASPEELDSFLADVSTYSHFLPYTKDARLVGREQSDLVVWLRQGNALLDASYTIRVRADVGGQPQHLVRFWLDPARPHGIDDASGFFRYAPIAPAPASPGKQRLLLTFGIWVDVGPGIVRALFEGRIQQIVLSVPQHLRDYVSERARAETAARIR